MIVKDGLLCYENYFPGSDENYGHELGHVSHSDTSLHDMRSITKSIISACVGIAIDQGLIENTNQKIASFFPELAFSDSKQDWTIEHFLTMSTGLNWNEDVPYDNPENDEIQMTYADDPIRYVLEQPLDTLPGVTFNYNGGATQVLAEIVERSSKMSIKAFAIRHLFDPLGINKMEWNKYSSWGGAEEYAAPSGLRLTTRSLLKFALLYRNKGRYRDQQIISEEWIVSSFSNKIEYPNEANDGMESYGYQFWNWPDEVDGKKININAAIGNGGQNIYWDLSNDLIVLTTAGNYNKWDIENSPYSLVKNYIYPALSQIK